MTFRSLDDRIRVRRIEADKKTASGTTIPDIAKEKLQEGEVFAAGPDARNETCRPKPLDLEVGGRRKSMLDDVAILNSGTAISEDLGVDGVGKKEQIQGRVTQIKETTSDYDREQLQERLAELAGGVAVIRVAGSTECEVKKRKNRVDGSIHATRAAVEEGHPARRRAAARSRQGTRRRRPEIRPRYRAARHRSSRAPDRGEQRSKRLHRHRQATRGCTHGSDAHTREFGDLFGQGRDLGLRRPHGSAR